MTETKLSKSEIKRLNIQRGNDQMIKSCKECKTVCCKIGPGPHVPIESEDFLEEYDNISNYNKQCIELSDDNKCTLWNSNSLPIECRQFVCCQREYSEQELKTIAHVVEVECPYCGAEWTIELSKMDLAYACEGCGSLIDWKYKRREIKNGPTRV